MTEFSIVCVLLSARIYKSRVYPFLAFAYCRCEQTRRVCVNSQLCQKYDNEAMRATTHTHTPGSNYIFTPNVIASLCLSIIYFYIIFKQQKTIKKKKEFFVLFIILVVVVSHNSQQ